MTNLGTFSAFAKKSLKFLLLFLVFLALGYLIYFRHSSNKNQDSIKPIPSLPPIENEGGLRPPSLYDFSNSKIKRQIAESNTHKIENAQITLNEAQKVASNFSITEEPDLVQENTTDGTLFDFQQGYKTLTVSQSILNYKTTEDNKNPAISFEELIRRTQSYVHGIEILKQPTLDLDQTKYLKIVNERYRSAASYQDAEVIEFAFDLEVDELPVYSTSQNPSQILVKVQKDGDVLSLNARFFAKTSSTGKFKNKSLEMAKSEIQNQRGIVVSSVSLDEFGQAVELYSFNPTPTNQIKITTINFAYYLPEDGEVLQPVYVFTGEFQITQNQKGRMTIYLPAIAPTQ